MKTLDASYYLEKLQNFAKLSLNKLYKLLYMLYIYSIYVFLSYFYFVVSFFPYICIIYLTLRYGE